MPTRRDELELELETVLEGAPVEDVFEVKEEDEFMLETLLLAGIFLLLVLLVLLCLLLFGADPLE